MHRTVTTPNPEPKHDLFCGSCHMILEKLIHLTPENLPKFVNDLKTSLSKSQQTQPSTSQLPAPPKEVSPRVNPPQETQSPKSPVRRDNMSPIRGLRQSPTPRQRIQLEKNRFSVLEDEESIECGAPPSAPSSPTSQHRGKNIPQTPKPQRTMSHK